MRRDILTKFLSGSLMAGGSIGIAATVYLKVTGVVGACMFAFGLIAVVAMKLPLFTGQAQHVCSNRYPGYVRLAVMLILNLVGCSLLALITASAEITAAAENIICARLAKGPLMCGLLAIPCGFIMTVAVRSAGMRNNWWPLLFGVPAFIICGFPHCIADWYYYSSCSGAFIAEKGWELAAIYLPTVLGNYIGCNLYRLSIGSPDWFVQLDADGNAVAPPKNEEH